MGTVETGARREFHSSLHTLFKLKITPLKLQFAHKAAIDEIVASRKNCYFRGVIFLNVNSAEKDEQPGSDWDCPVAGGV